MGQLLNISINLSKVNKDKIVTGKNGDKYYDITVAINDAPDQYGKDVQVWEKQSQDERQAKVNRNFLGGGWTVKPKSDGIQAVEAEEVKPGSTSDDELPF